MSLIHSLAHVDPSAEIGEGTSVGPLAYVGPGVVLGRDNELRAHCVVTGPGTTIGDRNVFFPGAVIGCEAQDKKYGGEATQAIVGNDNVFRENTTLHRGTAFGGGVTKLGNDNLLLAGAHVAHDCLVGDHVILANKVLLAGHVIVEDYAIMNGGSAMRHFGTVGTLSFVGGLSRLMQDAPPYLVVEGHPARVKKVNTVGLARRGHSEEQINMLRRAFRVLYGKRYRGRPLNERIAALDEKGIISPQVDRLRTFLQASAAGRDGRAGEAPK